MRFHYELRGLIGGFAIDRSVVVASIGQHVKNYNNLVSASVTSMVELEELAVFERCFSRNVFVAERRAFKGRITTEYCRGRCWRNWGENIKTPRVRTVIVAPTRVARRSKGVKFGLNKGWLRRNETRSYIYTKFCVHEYFYARRRSLGGTRFIK